MRLALDVLVYTGVVSVFVLKVVVLKDASTITPWEFVWLVYLVGAIWKQVCGHMVGDVIFRPGTPSGTLFATRTKYP